MDNVTFYYQERVDGGIRAGLEANSSELIESFHAGSEDKDPRLLWYVELRCQGEFGGLTSADAGREWLGRYGGHLRAALDLAADQLGSGLDVEFEPWTWAVPKMPAGFSVTVALSAARRVPALEVAKKLRALRNQWDPLIGGLQPLDAVPQV